MNCAEAVLERGSGDGCELLSLDILVVYEDLETGLRASQIVNRTVQRLEAPVDAQVNFWRLDVFREPAILQQAPKQKADVVFISTHGRVRLPTAVNCWLRQWFGLRGDEPRALAVLLDDQAKDTPAATELVEELSGAARSAGVEVFLPAEAEWESAITKIRRRAETTSLLLDEVLHRVERPSLRGFGIND